jgi:hypothetical protein
MKQNNTNNLDLINKIKTELVEKTYYDDVKYNIRSKSRWKIIGDVTEASSYVMTGIATILAFAAGFSSNTWLSFVAGCFSTGSLVFLQFSSYATRESKERTQQVNKILDKLGIEEIVDITIDSSEANPSTRMTITEV